MYSMNRPKLTHSAYTTVKLNNISNGDMLYNVPVIIALENTEKQPLV